MPGQEVSGAVDGKGVLHMNSDEVIVSGFGAGVLGCREFGGCFGDALDSGDVGFFLRGGDVAPVVTCQHRSMRDVIDSGKFTILDALGAYPLYMSLTSRAQHQQLDVLWLLDPTPHPQSKERKVTTQRQEERTTP